MIDFLLLKLNHLPLVLPREYERKMIEFEKQEVTRREQEIAEKKAALEDMKRKNQLVQDKVQEQIKTLTMKLEELRVEHQTNEASSDSIISCLQDMKRKNQLV